MANKPKLKFRVVAGRNPKTEEALLRPQIAERETYYMDQLVEYALNAGYVRGQFHDMRGALNGFVEAMQQLSKDGKAVDLDNWLRIHGELTGKVDETRQLTDANEYKVRITALKDLKRKVSDFSWTNIDDTGIVPKIDTITYDGCPDNWKIQKSSGFTATGRNLIFDAAKLGDTVKANWMQDGETKEAVLEPNGSGYSFIKFDWPVAFANVPVGTKIALHFTLHGGIEDGAAYGLQKEVTLVDGDPVDPLTVAKVASEGKTGVVKGEAFSAEGENLSYGEGDSVKVKWIQFGEEHVLTLTPSSTTPTKMSFAAVAAFDDIPDRTELTFVFELGGQSAEKTTLLLDE